MCIDYNLSLNTKFANKIISSKLSLNCSVVKLRWYHLYHDSHSIHTSLSSHSSLYSSSHSGHLHTSSVSFFSTSFSFLLFVLFCQHCSCCSGFLISFCFPFCPLLYFLLAFSSSSIAFLI